MWLDIWYVVVKCVVCNGWCGMVCGYGVWVWCVSMVCGCECKCECMNLSQFECKFLAMLVYAPFHF